MISIDPRKIETVYKFVDFLEAVSNPQALKDTVVELKAASDELKALTKLKEIADNADGYLDKVEKEARQKADAIIAEAQSKLDQSANALKDALATKEANDLEDKKKRELNATLREETKRYEALSAEAQTWLNALKVREEKVAAREVVLASQTEELEKKATALKALLS
jgi:hypothetical protein